MLRIRLRDRGARALLSSSIRKVVRKVLPEAANITIENIVEGVNKQTGIRGNLFQPLKPQTMRRKGSSKALIDTGSMLNSITWRWVGEDRVVVYFSAPFQRQKATWHQFGTRRGIPPREFFGVRKDNPLVGGFSIKNFAGGLKLG